MEVRRGNGGEENGKDGRSWEVNGVVGVTEPWNGKKMV